MTKKTFQTKSFSNLLTVIFCLSMITVLAIPLIGCQDEETKSPKESQEETTEKDEKSESEDNKEKDESQTDENEENPEETIDFQEVQPNELGDVMILMYHQIGDEEDTWQRTRENFREDLERLYEKDYRLVNLMDVVNGNIDLPPGKTPVVLTFDDASKGQFGYIEEDGEKTIDPDTAVGIILEMKEKYDDFTIGGTFYVNYIPVPFRDKELYEEKIAHLDELGFEIGNHGYNHLNLKDLDAQEIQEELGRPHKITENIIPEYQLESLALAFGAWPGQDDLKEFVYSGEYEDIEYEHNAVLNVGAEPANSPFHKDFDPLDLPRVRADQKRMDQWLSYYENNPEKRYVSDGNPDTITIPQELKEELNTDFKDHKELEIQTYTVD
ncbi:polysaccharide deacetylase family protein [Natranaerobius thermophilus]|uniref:Polysaccharide deacetylase n=1 Tax=Natranaerobius thermophilus (strain ATCC BAA-1301 / DSM 18059 / JW/NM-WN-LF) TaxID=457570 RepID=B2A5T7_NATTJ|nr:polysaccharide deacetylase family protein [Natranaerobius thermophilus]ACB84030.1 polysaccharide deacetylase [Natranaerobius thermophilus JW/NM-WN-LF]